MSACVEEGGAEATHNRLEKQGAPSHNGPMAVNGLDNLHVRLGQFHRGLRLLFGRNDAPFLAALPLLPGDLGLVDDGLPGRL